MKAAATMEGEPSVAPTTVGFLERLVRRFPSLAEDYECHLYNNHGPLPYVFCGIEVYQALIGAYLGESEFADLDWAGLLGFLDEEFAEGDRAVRDLIGTEFVCDMVGPRHAAYGITGRYGPQLTALFGRLRPGG